MKKIYLFAALATMLAACSENDLTVNEQPSKATETIENAVNFDVYVGRGLTRGGVNGSITTNSIQEGDHKEAGFGVFGYYTDGEPYSAITKPNFFYNQNVKYDATLSPKRWAYSPIKYWPNEFGGDAVSDQVDRVTLFAYLPWVDVDPLTGVVKPTTATTPTPAEVKATDPTTNITGMTRNTATGDPFIKYSATMDPTNSVDLCYGVAADNFTSSNSAINQNKIEKGKPYIDVVKPGSDENSKIKFDFKHATAQLVVTIDAKVEDKTNNMSTAPYATYGIDTDHTRIWVRSVTFTGITQKGALNLNSTAESPEWYDVNGNSKITTGSLTVFDGRKDGKEANDAASNEIPASLNTKIIQNKQYTINSSNVITAPAVGDQPGVVKDACNLFNSTSTTAPVFVIPTKEKMRVTIVYDVETVDKNLPYYLSDGKTPGSTVQNTIYKDIDTFGEITAGYCYTLKLHLGMRTVDFDAEVTPWQNYGADVDLPSNLQTFAANANPYPTVILPATATSYKYAVSGCEVNATLNDGTSTFTLTGSTPSATATPVNGSGVTTITVSDIEENKKVFNNTGTWTAYVGTKWSQLNVIQQAAPLGLSITIPIGGTTVALKKTTGSTWAEAIPDATDQNVIKVWRNGMLMSVQFTAPTTDNQVQFNSGSLVFNNSLLANDVVEVWIKAGNAAAESTTATVPNP
jgi:hypothetical protein